MSMQIDDVVLTCCNASCGIAFAVPAWWNKGKRETHSWFYCPNGHQQRFNAESDLDKARRERDIAKQQVARAEQEAAEAIQRANKAEREGKRLKKRASAGTCPCCQRTFANMATHMKKEHPVFVEAERVKLKVVK